MRILKLPTSPLYRGLARIFFVIAVAWTGLILFWVRDEHFDMVRPNATTVEQVDRWFTEIAMLNPSGSAQFNDLPADRRNLIQKAANSGAYSINGREQKLSASELKAYQAILESGFSEKVKFTLVGACKSIEPVRELSGMQRIDHRISAMPVWDFRGVDVMDLEMLAHFVQGIIIQLNEIQMEGVYGYTFTGLLTEKDLTLLDDLRTAQKNRWIVKPLFWVAAWIIPLLGLGLATLTVVELCRWIVRGFRPSAQSNP